MRFAEMWFVQGMLDCSFDDGANTLADVCLKAVRLAEPAAPRTS